MGVAVLNRLLYAVELRWDKPPPTQLSVTTQRETSEADDHTHEHHPERSRWEGCGEGSKEGHPPHPGSDPRELLALGFVSTGPLMGGGRETE